MNWPRLPNFEAAVLRTLRLIPLPQRGQIFLALLLGTTLLVFGAISYASVRSAEQRAARWIMRAAGVTADQVDSMLTHAVGTLERAARWPGMAESLARLQAGEVSVQPPWIPLVYLFEGAEVFPRSVFVTGHDGSVLWTKPFGLGLVGMSLAANPHVQAAMGRSGVYVSDLLRDPFWPEPYILVAAPIRDEADHVVGVVGGVMEPSAFPISTLARELIEHSAPVEIYITDGAGSIIASTNPQRSLGRIEPAELRAVRAHGHRRQAMVELKETGTMLAIHALAIDGWKAVIAQPTAEMHAEALSIRRSLLTAASLLALVLCAVAIPFMRSVVEAINELTGQARRIESGDLSGAVPVNGRDELSALAAAFESMRRQLALDQQTMRAQISQLAETNRLKNEFIANLSHEFRTPIHITRGYIDLILEGAIAPLPEDLREPLQVVRKSNETLWELIGNCLDLAKIDAGRDVVDVSTFDLCDLVREIASKFSLDMAARGLTNLVRLPPRGCPVTSDRGKVKRILTNFVSNALKFTEHGEVEIAVEDGPGPDEVTLRVRDTGIGINEADQKAVFDRFRQVDGSFTRNHDGVGIGLSIASELARLLRGRITLSSTPGCGSTFSFCFPRELACTARESADLRIGAAA